MSTSHFPLAGIAKDGWSNDEEASATCFCGSIQLAVPVEAPGLIDVFVCNCTDCRKITGSMFATNFWVKEANVRHLRGQELLAAWGQDETPVSGKTMTNFFCSKCGTLMYRKGAAFPGTLFCRVGNVDDFSLHESKLRPRSEHFTDNRVCWLNAVEGVEPQNSWARNPTR